MKNTFIALLTLLFLSSCYTDPPIQLPGEDGDDVVVTTKEISSISVKEITTESRGGGGSSLLATSDGELYFSWIEYADEDAEDLSDMLMYSRLTDSTWTAAQQIASGDNWFLNWADFPSIAKSGDFMAAHWLQSSDNAIYGHDIRVALSKDAGKTWGESFVPHRDSTAAEHGFVSMLPMPGGKILTSWLDGRKTKEGIESGKVSGQKGHEHGHGGPMTLRVAEFDINGELYAEEELDERVCDCCPTDAAMTADGPIMVYRDRSEDEVRDISIVRKENGAWTEPQPVYTDGWTIAGCPVNGPAVAAEGNSLAVAWFTAAGDKPQTKLTFSEDGGKTFDKTIRFDDGTPEGRVDVEWLDKTRVLVTWMENTGDTAEFRAKIVSEDGGTSKAFSLVPLKASRASGFPALAKSDDRFYLSWTDATGEMPKVRTAELVLE